MASPSWRWPLLLVAAVYLLTAPGPWYVTDQIESVAVARRALSHGTFTLSEPPVSRLPEIPWIVAAPGESIRSRLLPTTIVLMLPLLWVDQCLGLEPPRLLFLQGHLFVVAALALVGATVLRHGGSPSAAAAAVVVTGLAWPVWQVGHRGGAEPLLILLVALFLAATGPGRKPTALRALVCAALPWTHPTGPLVATCLIAAEGLAGLRSAGALRAAGRRAAPAAGGLVVGVVTLVYFWNHLYHGNWWAGGYGQYYASPRSFLSALDPVKGLRVHAVTLLQQSPVFVVLAVAAAVTARRGRLGTWGREIALAGFLTVAMVAFFATFHIPEPARRLAVLYPPWGVLVGAAWEQWHPTRQSLYAALFTSAAAGFYWFMHFEGSFYPGPEDGLYPHVAWVQQAISGSGAWPLMPLIAFGLGALALGRMRGEPEAGGGGLTPSAEG